MLESSELTTSSFEPFGSLRRRLESFESALRPSVAGTAQALDARCTFRKGCDISIFD